MKFRIPEKYKNKKSKKEKFDAEDASRKQDSVNPKKNNNIQISVLLRIFPWDERQSMSKHLLSEENHTSNKNL